MYCKICGEENELSQPLIFWSPDDGWIWGRLCKYCKQEFAKRKPKKEDFAYDKKDNYYNDIDGYIDNTLG